MALVATEGPERARLILAELVHLARTQQIGWQPQLNTPYVNTVAVQNQPVFPGRLWRWKSGWRPSCAGTRWPWWCGATRPIWAVQASWAGTLPAMPVLRICLRAASTTSSAAREGWARASTGATWCSFQPHSAPGVYARAFLEGRLSEQDLMHYRQR